MKKYKIIYADPPWSYNDKRKGDLGGAENHYPTMPISDIKNMPVASLSDENCILFIWVVFPLLQEGLDVIKSWGFKYKTLGFSWIKTNRVDDQPRFGIGHYTKSNCEICLIGIKGQPEIKSNSVSSVVIENIQEHSKKPPSIRKKIVELMGDIPRIELFARNNGDKNLFGENEFDGWDLFGNETVDSISLPKDNT